jgi:hypothetical protein
MQSENRNIEEDFIDIQKSKSYLRSEK